MYIHINQNFKFSTFSFCMKNIYKDYNVKFQSKVSMNTLFKIMSTLLYWRSAENHQTMIDFLKKKEFSYSHNIKIKIICSYCIYFVYGPSSFIKSLNRINLIEITLQTSCRRQQTKKLKTVFNSFISVKIFYIPPTYITQKTSAKTC